MGFGRLFERLYICDKSVYGFANEKNNAFKYGESSCK